MGGQDSAGNIVELTVEEHADAHRTLYEKYGKWQDQCAYLALSGRIGKEEIIRYKISESKKGENNPMHGTVSPNAGKFGEDSPRWGQKHTAEAKKKLAQAALKWKRADCPECGRTGILPGHLGRYHKDGKCKEI
jgi:ribosomal protein S27AE